MKQTILPVSLFLVLLLAACGSGNGLPSITASQPGQDSSEPLIVRTLPPATVAPSDTPSTATPPPLSNLPQPTGAIAPQFFPTPAERFGFPNDCIDTRLWTPLEEQGLVSYENCWMLAAWGFLADLDSLVIIQTTYDQGQTHAIYSPVPRQVEILLNLTVSLVQTPSNGSAILRVGLVPGGEPPDADKGLFLEVQSLPGSSESLSARTWQNGAAGGPVASPGVGDTQVVSFVLRAGRLTATLDDQPIFDNVAFPYEEPCLWVEYSIPMSSMIGAEIGSLSISGK